MSRRRKGLTAEDRILWSQVARTTRPLPGRSLEPFEDGPPAAGPEADGDGDGGASTGADGRGAAGRARPDASPPAAALPPGSPVAARAGAPAPIDRIARRKIERGRVAIEARIDLHGMRQSEAHALLQGFLVRAQMRGLRHVLVITGKGSAPGSGGVLKRLVPRWLAEAAFRPLVSGLAEAGRGHGGEGALYVRLKRREPGR